MKNLFKLLGIIAVVAIIGFTMASCASVNTTVSGGLLGGGEKTRDYVLSGGSIAKSGQASSTVWFGIFGKETFPSVVSVAKANGITKVATVEHYQKLGFLGLSTEFITIVSGE